MLLIVAMTDSKNNTVKIIVSLLVGLALCGCGALSGGSVGSLLTGKVVSGAPAGTTRIDAYPATMLSLRAPAPFQVPTGAEGTFQLRLPPGDYYLLARGEEKFAYYGRNPVTVPESGLTDLNVELVPIQSRPILPVEPFPTTGVAGIVSRGGSPVVGAMVFVYTDLTSQLKGMGYQIVGPTDQDGYFEAELPPGTYYLIARQRHGTQQLGPLRAGDLYGYLAANPITVPAEQLLPVAIAMLEVPSKIDRYAENLFGETSLHGQVVDAAGKAVAGVRAVLYDNPQMLNRPSFVSQPTTADGRFVLSFPHGGTYYLAARNTLGGAPGPGDLYGTYDATSDHSLSLQTGQALTDIKVVVEEMW